MGKIFNSTLKKTIKLTQIEVKKEMSARAGQILPLNELENGEYGKVVSFADLDNSELSEEDARDLKRHLMSMGFVKDAEIKFLKIAPLGDPIKIKVKGYDIALRKEEAKNIKVKIEG